MSDKIISVTLPKCGTCRYAQAFKADRVADCYGHPPIPTVIGAAQDPLGRPTLQIETFVPRVRDDRAACVLYAPKMDFMAAGSA